MTDHAAEHDARTDVVRVEPAGEALPGEEDTGEEPACDEPPRDEPTLRAPAVGAAAMTASAPSDRDVAPSGDETGHAADADETGGAGEADGAHGTFVVVEVVDVSFELPSPSPIVHLLEESAPFRSLYFPIGLPEAQSIALAIAGEQAPRPTTHDLLASVLAAAGCDVVAVRITGERAGTILAELDLMGPRGHEVVDCRPTDGIAIALRLPVHAPILCEAGLLER